MGFVNSNQTDATSDVLHVLYEPKKELSLVVDNAEAN